MSRTRKALITAAFGYAQSALAIAASFAVTPVVLRELGPELWGVWLASGALLGYAALAEFGILSVLPWLIAEADGKRDEAAVRSLVAKAFACSFVLAIGYLAVAAVLWGLMPLLLGVSDAERRMLAGPILLLVTATAVGFPLRVFSALLHGMQDVTFSGVIGATLAVAGAGLTLGLVTAGLGLYGLAAGLAAPSLFGGLACAIRARRRYRSLVSDLPRPSLAATRVLWSGGFGVWLSSMGWQMASTSDAIVLGALGARGGISTWAVTSRLGLTMMQLGWRMPDSGLVGLAQLAGESNLSRTHDVAKALARMSALLAGGVACVVLSLNPTFVAAWVGRAHFGGLWLNGLSAAGVVALSLAHGVAVCAAVLGDRPRVGLVSLMNGVVHVAVCFPLAHYLGLVGVALATVVSSALTTLPFGSMLLAARFRRRAAAWFVETFGPWALRFAPIAVLSAATGVVTSRMGGKPGLAAAFVATAALGIAHLAIMRPLLSELPFPARVRALLERLRLVSPPTSR